MTMTPQQPIRRISDNSAPEIVATAIEEKRKPGRPAGSKNQHNAIRDAQRARERRQREIREQRFEKQEAKRAQPIQPDQKGVLIVSLFLAGLAMVTSGIISYNGITSVAEFVGLSADWQASMFFGFVELLIVVFTILYLVLGSRSDDDGNPEKARIEFAGLITFSAIAIYGNLIHTLDFHQFELASIETWTGVVLSVSAPIAVIWMSKSASRVLFARTVRL